MRTLKAASVALLLLLMPHEAPQAESAASDEGKAVAAESETQKATSQPPATDEAGATAEHPAATPAESDAAKSSQRSESKVDSDGYSWSGRSLR